MRRSSKGSRGKGGFSLLELVIALLLFEIGLLAVAGMILTAQRTLKRSALILRGTVEAVRMGDSLLEAEVVEGGEVELAWGWIGWVQEGSAYAGLKVWALASDRADTLATLWIWPPAASMVPSEAVDSPPSGGTPQAVTGEIP